MSEEIRIKIPKKLAEQIDTLTEKGFFTSREDFTRCSIEIIAQLYGKAKTHQGGKSLLNVLMDNGKGRETNEQGDIDNQGKKMDQPIRASHDEKISPEECDILDLFTDSTFEYEDALHAKYTMELMKIAKPPLLKEEFIIILEKLAAKNKIEQTKHNDKIVWKVIDKY